MTRIQKILVSALVLFAAQALAAEVAGVKVDERIWLGDNPVSGGLKKALLGQGG